MSKLAEELARHANPDHVKAVATEKVSEWKELAKEKASEKVVELKEQAREALHDKAAEMKTHAKEAVMQRTMEVKDRVDTPRGWSLLGAILGAGVGAVLMKKAFTLREERHLWGGGSANREGFRYRGESYPPIASTGVHGGTPAAGMSGDISAMGGDVGGAGVDLKERVSDVGQTVKDKAVDLKDRAMDTVGQVRGRTSQLVQRIPSGAELKSRTTDWFGRTLENQPLMLAIGSIALGVFASLLLPVSNRERQLIEPAKRKAQESLSQLGDQLEEKLQGHEETGGSDVSGESRGDVGAMGSARAGSDTMEQAELLMGADRPGLEGEGEDRAESLATPTGSRIPPMPPLDDLTTKIH
ncbi:MAG: hypothetical protein ACJ8AT_12400 [Hyalangium sp.]|uniref:hypothetical protein n=1 Tax=Hyalangium sp. TaxID=2028555 RepID=UPI00389B1BF1